PRLPFDAPLAGALPLVPLTFLPLEVAFHAWQLITRLLPCLSLVLMGRWLPLGRRAPAIPLLGLLGFPATWALLSEGQSTALLLLGAVLLVGAWCRDSWRLAFVGGLLLALKPQYLPAYLILLGARRQWRPRGAAKGGAGGGGLRPRLARGPRRRPAPARRARA